MKIVALTIWYDEEPDMLWTVAVALAGFADAMVAVDGAFDHYPADLPYSPVEQWSAIAEGCESAGIELLAYRPVEQGVFPGHRGNEVEKRNASLLLAGALAADWVFAVDGDMVLQPRGIDRVRPILEATEESVAFTRIDTVPGRFGRVRNAFRWTPGLHYRNSHYELHDGDVQLAGPEPDVPALRLTQWVRYTHLSKSVERRTNQDAWYAYRDANAIET